MRWHCLTVDRAVNKKTREADAWRGQCERVRVENALLRARQPGMEDEIPQPLMFGPVQEQDLKERGGARAVRVGK